MYHLPRQMLKLDRRRYLLERSSSRFRIDCITVCSLSPRPSILTFFMLLRVWEVKLTRRCTASSHVPWRALTKVAAFTETAVDTGGIQHMSRVWFKREVSFLLTQCQHDWRNTHRAKLPLEKPYRNDKLDDACPHLRNEQIPCLSNSLHVRSD